LVPAASHSRHPLASCTAGREGGGGAQRRGFVLVSGMAVHLHRYTRGMPAVASCLEHFVTASLLEQFFSTGVLAPRAVLSSAVGTPLLDSEYLLGVMGLCQELSQYAIGRATQRDCGSVLLCSTLVSSVFGKLQEFDFRNGPLRRRFDGVKYVVRKCEDLLYELSLSGAYVPAAAPAVAAAAAAAQPPAAKRSKLAAATAAAAADGRQPDPEAGEVRQLFPRLGRPEDFDEMRSAMEEYDGRREELIKRCRDVQKLSKQAIYSLHRSNGAKAEAQLADATAKAQAITADFLVGHPSLRGGSFANAMEEYAEARLTQLWMEAAAAEGGKAPPPPPPPPGGKGGPGGGGRGGALLIIAGPSHPRLHGLVETSEYLGALADFTGEVGRCAVVAASRRDAAAVQAALCVDRACLRAWLSLGNLVSAPRQRTAAAGWLAGTARRYVERRGPRLSGWGGAWCGRVASWARRRAASRTTRAS
jgi:predicted translin family RNA/ssDNA-binding protein